METPQREGGRQRERERVQGGLKFILTAHIVKASLALHQWSIAAYFSKNYVFHFSIIFPFFCLFDLFCFLFFTKMFECNLIFFYYSSFFALSL